MIAVGVDTHKHEHVARALDGLGQVVGGLQIKANLDGYLELLEWLRALEDDVVVGIEGTGSYGAGLCELLLAEGIRVVEVERPRREDRRRGKSDEIDALLSAKKVLAGDGLSTPRAGHTRQALQALLVAQRSCIGERTRLLNQLQALHTGQTPEQIEKDSDRDRWFTAQEALEYGFVDHVVSRAAMTDNSNPVTDN